MAGLASPCNLQQTVFDLNIVATLRAYRLRYLFTHNVGDFSAFPALVLIPLELPR
jgi:hypothetical protein